jgi:lysozyme
MNSTAIDQAAQLARRFEGFRARPYRDSNNTWTIGYGTTHYPSGRAVQPTDPPCDESMASAWMRHDMAEADAVIDRLVKVPLTLGARIALLDFLYNFGESKFSASTLLRLLNLGKHEQAAAEFGKWVHSGPHVEPGLVKRRAVEADIFRNGSP